MDRGAWQATVLGVTELAMTMQLKQAASIFFSLFVFFLSFLKNFIGIQLLLGFTGGSMVKNPPSMQETCV